MTAAPYVLPPPGTRIPREPDGPRRRGGAARVAPGRLPHHAQLGIAAPLWSCQARTAAFAAEIASTSPDRTAAA